MTVRMMIQWLKKSSRMRRDSLREAVTRLHPCSYRQRSFGPAMGWILAMGFGFYLYGMLRSGPWSGVVVGSLELHPAVWLVGMFAVGYGWCCVLASCWVQAPRIVQGAAVMCAVLYGCGVASAVSWDVLERLSLCGTVVLLGCACGVVLRCRDGARVRHFWPAQQENGLLPPLGTALSLASCGF